MGTSAPSTTYRAAKGVEPMTPFQAESFFEKLLALCQQTRTGETEATVTVTIKKGHIDLIQTMVSEKLRPARS